MKRIITTIRANKILATALGIAIIIIIWLVIRQNTAAPIPTIPVTRGTLIQQVSVTGTIKPATDLQLAFEKSGKIRKVSADIGDTVKAGQVLVELDQTDLQAQLAQAQANVAAQQANLDALERGSRPEDIDIQRTKLDQAQQTLDNAYASVFDVLNDSYTKADDAVRKETDGIFTNPEQLGARLTFTTNNAQQEIDADNGRVQASRELVAWRTELDGLSGVIAASSTLDQALVNAQKHLLNIRDFLNKTMDAVLSAGNLSPDTVILYKTNITVGRTNVGLALSNVNGQQQQISSDAITLETIQGQLNLMLAGSDPQQIAAQAAQVAQAKASVQITLAQIAKSVIRSPIDGTVTKQDAKLGEIAAPNVPLVSVISSDALEIEANIPEADIAKVAIGNTADITFDAFGESVKFSGHVTAIDPAETVIEGVPTYKTTLLLDSTDPRIKPGLTANLDILTNKLENVLMIPQRAIAYRGDKKVVLIPHPGSKTPEEREITTGVRGSDTYIQVLTGLSEGEQIEPSPQ